MVDVHRRAVRSKNMAAVRSTDTRLEVEFRKRLFARGYRYRKNVRKLPGKPDLVFRKHGALVFVHGCFWHRHRCHLFKWPKSRRKFWREKLTGNVRTDRRNYEKLHEAGWRIFTVWECALKGKTRRKPEEVISRVERWLQRGIRDAEIAGQRRARK